MQVSNFFFNSAIWLYNGGLPFAVNSKSFDDGWRNNPYDGNDHGEYIAGRDARKMYDHGRNSGGSGINKSSGGNFQPPDGSAGNFWGKLILFVLAALVAIPSVFAALISSLVLWLLLSIVKKKSVFSYQQTYSGSFKVTFVYLSMTVVLAFLMPLIWPGEAILSGRTFISNWTKYFLVVPDPEFIPVRSLLKFHSICAIIPALILSGKMSGICRGFIGYLISLSIMIVIIVPAVVTVFYFVSRFLPDQFRFVTSLF